VIALYARGFRFMHLRSFAIAHTGGGGGSATEAFVFAVQPRNKASSGDLGLENERTQMGGVIKGLFLGLVLVTTGGFRRLLFRYAQMALLAVFPSALLAVQAPTFTKKFLTNPVVPGGTTSLQLI
jgi:hypothetical protein